MAERVDHAPSGKEYDLKGDVKFSDPQINPKTGTFAVRAALPNSKTSYD